MYSVVLMAALSTSAAEPGCHWRCGCSGYYSCYGCSGCYGCYGCYGCHGTVMYGCYGCHGCSGCYGCYGCYSVYAPVIMPAQPAAPATKPEAVPPPKKEVKLENQARLIVSVPKDAKLFIDDQLMKATSDRRVFRTPTLDKDQTYYYVLRAEVVRDGKTLSETKQVIVKAGSEISASFSELQNSATATASADR